MQVPSNIFLTKLPPSKYLPAVMSAWGVLSALCGTVSNVGGLWALRFLLGFIEAAFYRKLMSLPYIDCHIDADPISWGAVSHIIVVYT